MSGFENAPLEDLVNLQGTTRIHSGGSTPKRRKKFWKQFKQEDGSYLIHSDLFGDWMEDCISWSAAEARDEIRSVAGPGYKEPNYWIYLIIIVVASVIGIFICTLPS